MGSYKFRIRFHLDSEGVLQADGSTLCASLEDSTRIALQTEGKENPISEADRLILEGCPYQTEAEAWETGRRAKDALLLTCASMRIAVDVGNDRANLQLAERVKAVVREAGKVRIREDVHGLMVYDSSELTSFADSSAIRLVLNNDAQKFLAELTQILSQGVTPSEKQRLALELLGVSRFETSVRARFLTCMLAYETLLAPEKKAADVLKMLSDLRGIVEESDLNADDKESLKNGVASLKTQSITSTGKALASTYLGDKNYLGFTADKFFGRCYNVRSSLVHSGVPKTSRTKTLSDTEFGTLAANLELMLSDLLVGMLLPTGQETG